MASNFDCPSCLARTQYKVQGVDMNPDREAYGQEVVNAYLQCTSCTFVFGGVTDTSRERAVVDWWPRRVAGKEFPDVPEQIASTADEAHKCLSIGAYRGAVALARSVVESTAKDHGITQGLLHKKIEKMAEQRIISQAMKDAADHIRFAGNEVAHGDLVEEPMNDEDAHDVLALMDAILTRVYQEPRQVERVRARRRQRAGKE